MEFAVDSSYRNRGIGKEMLDKACQIAKEHSCTQIEVACNQLRKDTHRFYEREGMHNFHFKFSKSLLGVDTIENSILTLYISDNQEPWCPEWNGEIRVSNLQTGVFSSQVGSSEGQHRFTEGLVVREEQKKCFLVTPKYGTKEMKARCKISDENVAALWLIGIEEEPHQSAEICLFELKGYNVNKDSAIIGFGVHPFGDKKICDEFYEERFEIDVTEWNTYRFTWTQNDIAFFINNNHIKTIKQSPEYPMQLMLNLYDLQNIKNEKNVFEIDYVMVDD